MDEEAVKRSIKSVETAKASLEMAVRKHLNSGGGKADFVKTSADVLEVKQIQLAAHLPKLLAAGDTASALVQQTMEANDAAQAYANEVKGTLCPDVFGGTPGSLVPEKVYMSDKLTVAITTLTNRTTTIELDADSTIAYLKSLYQDQTGTPPDQQRLIFPVDAGTKDAKQCDKFSWWTQDLKRSLAADRALDIVAGLTQNHLLLGKGFMTVGEITAKAGAVKKREDGAAQCYVVLQLRASPDDEEFPTNADGNTTFGITENFANDIAALDKEFAEARAANAAEAEKDSAALDVELMSEGDADEVLENAFKVFDKDGSGTLSAAELKDILTRVGTATMSEEDAQEVVRLADVNGDGELSIAEFIKLMKATQLEGGGA